MNNILILLPALLCLVAPAMAGTVTGQIQTPSTGRGIANGTLTFTLSQAAVVSGTATLAGNGTCWTDSTGNIVGLPGDAAVAAPVLSSNLGSGSLGSGTYFVRTTWANATGESQPSAERSLALGSSGTLIVQAPVNVPALATSMKVYIGSASGGETLQGSVGVTGGVIAGNFNQATPLVNGAALPANNTSVCQIRFNDELQPSFTAYSVALTNSSGAGIAGFPQKWYLSGGSNGTVNVSNGTPLYAGVVQYPQAIVSNPAANGTQSINGGLNLNGFSLTNTGTGSVFTGAIENLTGTQATNFGSHATTTTETIINSGSFPYSGPFPQSDVLVADINGVDFQQEQIWANRPGVMDAIAGGVHVPSTQSALYNGFGMQFDGVAGYVYNEGPNADPVGVYGQATVNYNNTGQNQSWAGNLWCGEGTGNPAMTQNGSCYGLEIDIQQLTNKLGGWAEDFNGSIPFGGIGGLLWVKPGAGFWKPGMEFGTGATLFPDNTGNGAIVFQPVAAGNNQPSQGMLFESVDSGGTTHYWQITEGSDGSLSLGVPNVSQRMIIGVDGHTEARRFRCNLGSGLVSGDFSLGGNWGTSPSVSSINGQDCAFTVQVTTGSGSPGANPTITLTYHNGPWTGSGNPIVVCSRSDANAPVGNAWVTTSPYSTTQVTLLFAGTPNASTVYSANCIVIQGS